tara:strand:+ start:166 stop:393 length:228 start_codon:yes stop_codon:yes gene_type:complete
VSQADIICLLEGKTSVPYAKCNPQQTHDKAIISLTHLANSAQRAQKKLTLVHASNATTYGMIKSEYASNITRKAL